MGALHEQHGTRACYVRNKCRCELCRGANVAYYHERQKKLKKVLTDGIKDRRTKGIVPKAKTFWVPKKGKVFERVYTKACPGVDGHRCRWKSFLRKDSKGGICGNCRELLLRADRVSAKRALHHLRHLSVKGVGTRAVQLASGVSKATLQDILSRAAQRIDRETERKILEVGTSDRLGGALVSARTTWEYVRWLIREAGMSKAEISAALGNKTPALQLRRDFVTQKNARAIARLHGRVRRRLETDPGVPKRKMNQLIREILSEGVSRRALAEHLGWKHLKFHVYKGCASTKEWEEMQSAHLFFTGGKEIEREPVICGSCGLSHEKKPRLERLKRLLPMTLEGILDKYPCVYPRTEYKKGTPENRMVFRDLQELGAKSIANGIWVVLPSHEGSSGPALENRV